MPAGRHFTIADQPSAEAIEALAVDPATMPDVLDQELLRWAREV